MGITPPAQRICIHHGNRSLNGHITHSAGRDAIECTMPAGNHAFGVRTTHSMDGQNVE